MIFGEPNLKSPIFFCIKYWLFFKSYVVIKLKLDGLLINNPLDEFELYGYGRLYWFSKESGFADTAFKIEINTKKKTKKSLYILFMIKIYRLNYKTATFDLKPSLLNLQH